MTDSEFNVLSINEKSYILWTQGEHLDSAGSGAIVFGIYSLHGMFVEVTLFHYDVKDIQAISGNSPKIEKYLEKVKTPSI